MFVRLSNCLTKGFLFYCIWGVTNANINTLGDIWLYAVIFLLVKRAKWFYIKTISLTSFKGIYCVFARQFNGAVWYENNKKYRPCNRSANAAVKLIAKVKVVIFFRFFLKNF